MMACVSGNILIIGSTGCVGIGLRGFPRHSLCTSVLTVLPDSRGPVVRGRLSLPNTFSLGPISRIEPQWVCAGGFSGCMEFLSGFAGFVVTGILPASTSCSGLLLRSRKTENTFHAMKMGIQAKAKHRIPIRAMRSASVPPSPSSVPKIPMIAMCWGNYDRIVDKYDVREGSEEAI